MKSLGSARENGRERKSTNGGRKRSFVGIFNERTHKLIELSRSNSCSDPPFPPRENDGLLFKRDSSISQSSDVAVKNRHDYRQERLKKRMLFEPLHLNINDIADAPTAIKRMYEELLDEKSPLDAFERLLATLRSHFSSSMWWTEDADDVTETHIRLFIRTHLLSSATRLSEKYLVHSGEMPLEKKLGEYKLQTLLHMFALLPKTEDPVDQDDDLSLKEAALEQVVAVLRMIASATDARTLQEFLNDDVLDAFLDRFPRHLIWLYDDLNQPLPPELSIFVARDASGRHLDEDVLISPSVKAKTTMDEAPGSHPLIRRTSILNFRHHKLVEIPADGAKQLKLKDESKKTVVSDANGKGRQARRSLTFEVQPTQQTPKKRAGDRRKPSSRTPKRRRPVNAVIRETPIHKQRPLSEYRKDTFKRVNAGVRQIVAETPQKAPSAFLSNKKSPHSRKASRALYTSAPTALVHLEEEKADNPAHSSSQHSNESCSVEAGDRRGLLLKEFMTRKSPTERMKRIGRTIASICSKS